jgi:UDP-glucose 4-epimerase
LKILVTGGTGFIGRHIVNMLTSKGFEVSVLSRRDVFSEKFTHGVNLILGDINNITVEDLRRYDGVIHMAARTPVRHSWRESGEFIKVNYLGTVRLVDALSKIERDKPWLIYYSTAEVIPIDRPAREDDKPNPQSPYAISKYVAELYVREHYPLSVIVRPANTFDRSILAHVEEARGYFVEKAVIQALEMKNGKRQVLKFDGYPETVRTWIHISDHVKAIELLVDRVYDSLFIYKNRGSIWHIGSVENTASCSQIVSIIADILGLDLNTGVRIGFEDIKVVSWGNNPRPWDPPVIALDGSRFMEEFNWKPKDLKESLKITIENWRKALGL